MRTMARPTATRWRWPPESCFGLRSSSCVMPSISAASFDQPVDLGLGRLADLQAELEVLADRHVRVERVALEDHGDVAVLRGDAR